MVKIKKGILFFLKNNSTQTALKEKIEPNEKSGKRENKNTKMFSFL